MHTHIHRHARPRGSSATTLCSASGLFPLLFFTFSSLQSLSLSLSRRRVRRRRRGRRRLPSCLKGEPLFTFFLLLLSSSSFFFLLLLLLICSSEEDLPECSEKNEVCSKVDLYGDPWVERQCRCQQGSQCSSSLHADDGHTVVDKTRQYKLCEPVKRLPICRYFKDVTWTIAPGSDPNNSTIQKVNCRCRPGSVAYLLKRQFYMKDNGQPGFIYSFACSPQSRMRCQAKEPCRLFTVHKKTSTAQALAQGLEDVNASPLCMCQKGYRCPKRHTDPGSLPSPYYGEGMGVKVFSGHCVPQRHPPEPVYTLV
ncbi:unnamed protein product [Trichogramma brassicae]|uniref:Protein giant-lens n=1 Tax=Trichogramma brassicae TaxID=86971 RepID=A0A6H5IR32_9HYME|nr:unnamed protein product [Trichogramma brassicae]